MTNKEYEYRFALQDKCTIHRHEKGTDKLWEVHLVCETELLAAKIMDLLTNPSLALDQQYQERLRITEGQLARYINLWRQSHVMNLRLTDALRRAKDVIEAGIYDEDGMDGGYGEIVLEYIRQTIDSDDAQPTNEAQP